MGEEKSNVVVCEHMKKLREWLDIYKIPWFDFSDDFGEICTYAGRKSNTEDIF